jgi:hypothetical protein
MFKIEIKSTELIERTSRKGAPYYKQTGYAFTMDRDGVPNAYPERIMIMVSKNASGLPQPYQPGMYQLHPSSLRVGQYNDLEIGFINLQPISQSAGKPSDGKAA